VLIRVRLTRASAIGCAVCAVCVLLSAAACNRAAGFFRQYEYEEEMYLSLDGSATVYVNASIPALNAQIGRASCRERV